MQHRQVAALQPGHPVLAVLGLGRRPRAARLAERRNQYASTGTMVIETSSDAPRAMATVVENGRNNSP